MSGMALLLLCAMQPDAAGWRRQIDPNVTEAAGAVGQVPPQDFAPLRAGAEPFLDEAGRMLEAGVAEAESALGRTRDEALEQVRELLSETQAAGATGAAPASGWPEIERALEEPVDERRPAAPSIQPTLRDRMRRPEAAAAIPRWPTALPSAASDGHSPTADGQPLQWPDTRETGEEPSLRVSQSLDRAGNRAGGEPNDMESDAGLPDRGREVIYEADSQAGQIGQQRYLSPPKREDELVGGQLSGQDVRSANARHRAGSVPGDERRFDLPMPNPPAESSVTRTATAQRGRPGAEPAVQADERNAARPWGPLVLAVLALFGSLGLNFYLGWIAWDLYARHQDAVDDIHELEAKLESKQQQFATTTGPRIVARQSLAR